MKITVMLTSVAAVNSETVDDFVKALTSMVMSYDFAYESAFIGQWEQWTTGSKAFLRRFGMSTATWSSASKYLRNGNDPTEHARYDAKIQECLAEVREVLTEFKQEIDISDDHLKLIRDLCVYGKTGTKEQTKDNALKRLDKAIVALGEKHLTALFIEELGEQESQGDLLAELRKLTHKMVGERKTNLTAPEKKKYQDHKNKKGEQHKDYAKFLELRREITRVYKQNLKQLVRNSGKATVTIASALHFFRDNAMEHNIPQGFTGRVDENGGFYTKDGRKVGSIPMGILSMNPSYSNSDDTFVLTVLTDAGNVQHVDTESRRKTRTAKKFEAVGKFIPVLKKVRSAWRLKLKTGVKTVEGVAATLAELVYLTSARVGSDRGETAGEKTFGITTVLVKHLQFKGNKLHIKYPGKKGGMQHHIVEPNTPTDKRVLANIVLLLKGKGKNEKVFTVGTKSVRGGTINKLLRTLGVPSGFTVHKLRTVRATLLAKELLDQYDGGLSNAEANKWVIEKMKEIGLELGHFSGDKVTASTAITHYIDPSVFAAFYKKYGLRAPAVIQKAIAKLK
jgi:DNA topoisomerase IB